MEISIHNFFEGIFIWGRLTVLIIVSVKEKYIPLSKIFSTILIFLIKIYDHDILNIYEIYIIFYKIQILNMTLYLNLEDHISQENFYLGNRKL